MAQDISPGGGIAIVSFIDGTKSDDGETMGETNGPTEQSTYPSVNIGQKEQGHRMEDTITRMASQREEMAQQQNSLSNSNYGAVSSMNGQSGPSSMHTFIPTLQKVST